MKLYSQNGAMEGNKVVEGLHAGFIDGAILSPKDIQKEKLADRAEQYKAARGDAEIFFDPQFYASVGMDGEGNRLGNLLEDYSEYFALRRRSVLEREKAIQDALEPTLSFQASLPFIDAVIAPNILISKSLDSAQALISKNFIRLAPEIYRKVGGKRPLYVTLAISREAMDKDYFLEFANEITALEQPPYGFYVLLGARNTEDRSEIYNPKILAYWMYLNYVLSLNGFKVINGFSDLVSPLLAAVGGSGSATGWWSNLRAFSLARFEPAMSGGRQPTPRYISTNLLNRITYFELDQLRKIVPSVVNGLPSDAEYPEGDRGSEPQRAKEILQTWDAIKKICTDTSSSDIQTSLKKIEQAATGAEQTYLKIQSKGIQLEPKSNSDHLSAIRESIGLFRKLAELDS